MTAPSPTGVLRFVCFVAFVLLVAIPQRALAVTATDNFNRANGSLGPNWTDITDGGLAIVSDQVVGTNAGANSGDIRTAETYANDQYSQIQIFSTALGSGQWIGPAVRATTDGQNLYVGIYYNPGSGADMLEIFRRAPGDTWFQLASTTIQSTSPGATSTGTLAAGSLLQLSVTGSSLTLSVNGTTVLTASDTNLTDGDPGIIAYSTPAAGPWAGGDNPTYTVGGSASGLSGTVVLQDNGGDNLSVAANGSFTFATALAPGAAYNVTVATNPAGQACTVANGSGTVASDNVTNVTVSCTASTSGSYTVGGSVSGLSGTVVLQDNGGDNLSVTANGSFTFAAALAPGAAYIVTVATNPAGQTCTVANGTGTASANVTNVAVSCTANLAMDNFNRANGSLGSNWTDITDGGLAIVSDQVVGPNTGAISGDIRTAETYADDQYSQIQISSTPPGAAQWIGPAVRATPDGQNLYVGIDYNPGSGADMLEIFRRAPGSTWFQLASTTIQATTPGATSTGTLAAGSLLQLSVTGSSLTLSVNGATVLTASDTNLTDGDPGIIAYGTPAAGPWAGGDNSTYTVGGSASGLSGTVVLQDNGGDNLNVTANGSFAFATGLAPGVAYNVTVATNPPGQICTVADGSGTIASDNVTNVAVSCTASTSGSYTVGGSVSGLSGTVVLQDNGGDNLSVTANGSFTFATALAPGAAYSVTVATNPAGQTCTVANGSGGIASANVTNVTVSCAASASGSITVGGTVSGLSGTVVLQDNGGDNLSVAANGSFTFATALAPGVAYSVTVATNPAGQTCTVANGSGTIASANVTSVTVSCTASAAGSITVGGTVSGLSGAVELQDNGGDNLGVAANGSFTFATALASGAAYSVTVEANPAGQTCTVANGSGTIGSANVSNVAVTCTTNLSMSASDSFNRSDGSLGANWTDMSFGGLTIASDQVVGTLLAGSSGDIRTAETYPSDQYSQIQLTSTPLGTGQWIGPAVRAQNGGQNLYVGIYYCPTGCVVSASNPNPAPELMVFKESASSWSQLGNSVTLSAPLPAGTTLKLMVVGNTLSFLVNGQEMIAAGDSSYSSGAPGIIAYGTATAGNWSGGTAGFEVHYLSTDANGIASYDVISANNGYGPQVLRVLRPASPAAGVAHNFLYALPVEAGLGSEYGDAMATLSSLDAQDQYNVTIVEPSFYIDPWYANNPNDPRLKYETFMTTELQPWVIANLATSGTEQHWLIGFSKSGNGGQDLILKHPNLFTLAASWDFPADMSTYNELGTDPAANYGTNANFQANYQLSQSFVAAYKAPFLTNNRIWIGGYNLYQQDVVDYDTLLTSQGIVHTTTMNPASAHSWTSGWISGALAALYQDSINQQ